MSEASVREFVLTATATEITNRIEQQAKELAECQARVVVLERLFCESIVATSLMDKNRNLRMTCDVQELLTYFNGHKPA